MNSSFENYSACPNREDQLHYLHNWTNPYKSSPDYFNSCNGDTICNKTIVGIPYNFNGYKKAHTGSGYVGIVLCSSVMGANEYIQVKLKTSLVSGKRYRFSFWVSVADSSDYRVNGVSICFSKNSILRVVSGKGMGLILSTNKGKSIWCKLDLSDERRDWIEIKGEYISVNEENYITIGVFEEDEKFLITKRIRSKRKKPLVKYAYYFIDDVLLALDSK